MKSYLLLLFVLLGNLNGFSQTLAYKISEAPQFLKPNSDPLKNPYAGGLEAPQFSAIDLNNDNKKDLFVFDRFGAKVLTFINTGTTGQVSYKYAPEYEDQFPALMNWALLVDYNFDGREDIFTGGYGGIMVYKNTSTSTSQLSFTRMTDLLLDITGLNIYTSNVAIPAIADVDNDGDIDILAFGILGGYVEYSRNESVELGYSRDSLIFKSVDQCWGSFEELPNSHNATLGINCSYMKFYKTSSAKMHSGSTLLVLDMDNDGDKDMIHGSVGFNDLILFKNGKSQFSWPIDTMIQVDTMFPSNSLKADVSTFPAAFFVDVDNDNKRDLLVAPNEKDISKNAHQVLYYKNTGTDLAPVFTFQQDDFLQDEMVDMGSGMAPAFLDYDGDGDKDLFAGTHGNFLYTNNFKDRILLFKNVGSATEPVYQLLDTNYLGLISLNTSSIAPNFGDLNGDGKQDLVYGDYDGSVYYYENTGITTANFTLVGKISDNNGVIDVGSYSTPQIIDLDRDGKPDLVIGERAGNFNYYRNTGTITSPSFVLITDSLGNVVVNDSIVQYEYDPNNGNVIDSYYVFDQAGYSAPCITDLDNDSQYEMLSGSNYGRIVCYRNIESNLNGTFSRDDKILYDSVENELFSKYFGERIMVAAEHLNGGFKKDIMAGNYRGGFNVFMAKDSAVNPGVPEIDGLTFSLFPNPASGYVNIMTPGVDDNLSVSVYNTLGQTMFQEHILSGGAINISSLNDGMYLIEISSGKKTATTRLAVIKP